MSTTLPLPEQIDVPASPPAVNVEVIPKSPESYSEPLSRVDAAYWLAHCEGFRVDGAEGKIGFVEEIRQPCHDEHEALLVIRLGLLGRRVILVPASSVQAIVPRVQRVWLRTPTAVVGSEPLRRIEQQGQT